MDAKEIKACLKAAREAIRNKEFKDASKHCKAVLAEDHNNYNALVFLGVTAEGLEQVEQALKAYKKAAEVQPNQLLAWQGISGMLEKNPGLMSPEESAGVFEKLLTLHASDEAKQIPQLHKLYDLYLKSGQKEKALQIINKLLDVEKETESRIKPLCTLISLMSPCAPKLAEPDLLKYESLLREVILAPDNLLPDRDAYARLLLLLISQMKVDELQSTCEQLIQDYPTLPSPLEFQLRLVIDQNIGEGYPSQATCDTLKKLTSSLCEIQDDNFMVKVGQAFNEIQMKNYLVARDLLVDNPDECVSGWYLLAQTYLYLHSRLKCLEACQNGLSACMKKNGIFCASVTHVQSLFELAKAEAYMEVGTEEARSQALMILEDVQEKMPTEAFLIKAYIFLNQGRISEAQECVSYLPSEALPVQTLQAKILFEKKAFSGARKILQDVVSADAKDARATLLLGIVLWELRKTSDAEDVLQECFTTLLKAAKLDPYNYQAFLYIGCFYEQIQNDAVKARRCFQKAFDLQPESDECGSALVDVLLELGEEDKSLQVLQRVTQMAPAGCAKWAWLRLGLYQIRQGDPSTAIVSLQSALRADPEDQHVWECLAEAYLHRGSFTASLKAFIKASELHPDSVYCLQQIANIKHTLGLAAEAIEGYRIVLQKSPTYVPALKGISESLMQLAKQNLAQCLDGLAQSHFEEAIVYITRAASQRPDMSCLWKLMGDVCTAASCLFTDTYSVPSKLVAKQTQDQQKEEKLVVSKTELLHIGSRCYSEALKILPENGSLWHDLGVNLFYQSSASASISQEDKLSLIGKASQVMRKAIYYEPKEWKHWNALGVMASIKICHKPSLAQHCFIKSIECENNNVIAWTNLGALYLDKGEVKLAHDAFSAAQSIDPTYMACWIGQALVAEIVGHEETMDLFRHTTELGFHVESAISYGQWVLSMLGDSSKRDSSLFRYCIQQMAALPAASDALSRYTTRVENDATAFNMQGLLFEHQNMLRSSKEAFQKASTILEARGDNHKDLNVIRLNRARILCKQKKFDECVQEYESCDLDSNLKHLCMYGLALLRCGRLDSSLKVYQSALALAPEGCIQSQIHAALGMVAFMQGDLSSAKSHLFDGFQTAEPSLKGLFALCSLGLLQNDITLAMAVLEELCKREDAIPYRRDTLLLEFYKNLLEGNGKPDLVKLQEDVEANPMDASTLSLLARITLLTNVEDGVVAAEYAKASMANECSAIERAKQRMLESLGQLSAGHHSRVLISGNALKSALKTFHENPGCVSAQATLACAVHAEAGIREALNGTTDLLHVEESLLENLLQKDGLSEKLQAWCLQQLVVTCLLQDKNDSAKSYLKQLQDQYHKISDVKAFGQIITGLLSDQPDVPLTDVTTVNGPHKLAFLVYFSRQENKIGSGKAISLLHTALDSEDKSIQANNAKVLLEKIAFLSYKTLQLGESSSESAFENAVQSLKDKEMTSPIVSLLQALQTMKSKPDNKRLVKHFLATALDQIDVTTELGYLSCVLRQELLHLLWDSKKETDQQMVKGLLEDAAAKHDQSTAKYYEKLIHSKYSIA